VTVVLSLFLVAVRASMPRRTFLVRVPGTDSFRGSESGLGGSAEPALIVYRFDAPLFFANAQLLADDVLAALSDPGLGEPVRWVVIDAEAISDIDSTGAGTLADLSDDLRRRGVTLTLARLKAPVAAYLVRAGVIDKIGLDLVHVEVDDAVAAFHESTQTAHMGTAARE
jgi:SulP family sulfate permease